MLARGILGSGWTRSAPFQPFPNSSGWWWLISSVFLTRTSCHKTTHANGYYGAWPGCMVSVRVLPLTKICTWFSLASHSYSESFLVVHTLFGQDGCQREGFWEVVRYVVSPFDFSRTLPVGGGLLVPCFLPGPPVNLCKWLLWCLARVDGFSQCASPKRIMVSGTPICSSPARYFSQPHGWYPLKW